MLLCRHLMRHFRDNPVHLYQPAQRTTEYLDWQKFRYTDASRKELLSTVFDLNKTITGIWLLLRGCRVTCAYRGNIYVFNFVGRHIQFL